MAPKINARTHWKRYVGRKASGEPVEARLVVSRVLSEDGEVAAEWLLISNIMEIDVSTLALWYCWRWQSELCLKRQLGVSYPTAWLIQQKLMQAMVERDAQYTLCGDVQVHDAYLGGEFAGGKAGRGSEDKVPFVSAISLSAEGRHMFIKMAPVPGFTRKAIADWVNEDLSPGCIACWLRQAEESF